MADLFEYVESLPDYNVFEDENSSEADKPVKKRGKKRKRPMNSRNSLDYDDGYGIYVEKKIKGHDYLTVFFFPIVILWLEFSLRIGSGESFGFNSIVYTGAFSLVAACVLTVVCTFGGRIFNLVLCNLLTFAFTFWFVVQLLYHSAEGRFMRIADFANSDLNKLMSHFGSCILVILLMLVPFLFNVIIGWRIFTFRKIRIPAKISLVLIAVLLHLSAATMISLSKNNPYTATSYNLYNKKYKINECADRFGLLTTQRLDFTNMFTN